MRAYRLLLDVFLKTSIIGLVSASAYALWSHGYAWHQHQHPPVIVHAPAAPAATTLEPACALEDTAVPAAQPESEPAPAPAEAVSVAPGFGPGSCPAPDAARDSRAGVALTDVPELAGYHEDYGLLAGVATSAARHGVIAVWTRSSVLLSTDDGKTFQTVLDGPGAVSDVAVDCRGRVFALRGHRRLGVRDGERERWHTLDFTGYESWSEAERLEAEGLAPESEHAEWYTNRLAPRIAAGGGYIGWFGAVSPDGLTGRLALSDDGGASWRFRDVEFSDGAAHLTLSPEGHVQLTAAWFDCMSGAESMYTGPADADLVITPTPDIEAGALLAGDGWAYTTFARCADGDQDGASEQPVCALAPGGGHWRATNLAAGDDANLSLASNGRVSLGVVDRAVVRLKRGKLTVLAKDVPVGFSAESVDSSGRLLGLLHGHLVRWSKRQGWRVLYGPALELAR